MTIFSLLLQSWDEILLFINDLHNTGVSWGAVIAALILWNKMKRNKRFQDRDIRMEAKIDALLQERGVVWNGKPKTLKCEEVRNLRILYLSLQMAINQVYQKRRVRKMNQVNWTTLVPGLISAAKLVLQSFGIDIPDEHINAIVNGAAAVGAIIAIFLSHKKQGGTINEPTQFKSDINHSV
jgi:uncharacterized membrane protein